MVERIAKHLKRELELHRELGDLVNDGYVGLLEAADQYDPERGEFERFAYYRVRGAMIDGVRRSGRVSQRAHEKCRRAAAMNRAMQEHEDRTHVEGEPAPDRNSLGAALDAMLAEVAGAYAVTLLAQHEGRENPEEALLTEEKYAQVRGALEGLTDDQRDVVDALFYKELRQEEAASLLKVTRMSVAKRCGRALDALRDKLR